MLRNFKFVDRDNDKMIFNKQVKGEHINVEHVLK